MQCSPRGPAHLVPPLLLQLASALLPAPPPDHRAPAESSVADYLFSLFSVSASARVEFDRSSPARRNGAHHGGTRLTVGDWDEDIGGTAELAGEARWCSWVKRAWTSISRTLGVAHGWRSGEASGSAPLRPRLAHRCARGRRAGGACAGGAALRWWLWCGVANLTHRAERPEGSGGTSGSRQSCGRSSVCDEDVVPSQLRW
jgi:hypothetical protein